MYPKHKNFKMPKLHLKRVSISMLKNTGFNQGCLPSTFSCCFNVNHSKSFRSDFIFDIRKIVISSDCRPIDTTSRLSVRYLNETDLLSPVCCRDSIGKVEEEKNAAACCTPLVM